MFIIAIFLFGWIVQLLWNALIPDLFHGPWLSYWQSVGLLLLSRILVGFKGRHRGWKHWKRCGPPWRKWGKWSKWNADDWNMGPGPDYCGPWQGGWQNWQKLTPEEKQRAKEEWRKKKEEWKSSWKQGE